MPQALYILIGALLTLAVSIALGRIALRRTGAALDRDEENALGFVLGAAILSAAVFALASAHLIYKGVFLVGGILAIAAAVRLGAFRKAERAPSRLPGAWRWIFGIPFAVFLLLYVVNAMAPEMSPDGSTYHLGLVARYYRAHGFPRITTNMYANLSQGVEMLFLFAWAFGRHSAASLVHLGFLVALTGMMFSYGRRFGHPVAGGAAALFVFLSPVAGVDATNAYNDVALAAVLFALFYLLQIWLADRIAMLAIPIGLLAGFGYGVKYTAFLAVPYALGVMGLALWRGRKPLVRPLMMTGVCAAVMIVPWMLKNWVIVRNPVSPFLNRVFPNPYVHVSLEREWSEYLRHYGMEDRRQIPLAVTVRGDIVGGVLGPLFLLLPLALGGLRNAEGRRLLVPGVLFALPYAANIGTRFLLPPLPFWSLAMALALSFWRPLLAILVLSHALLSWPNILKRYCARYAWRLDAVPWREALRVTSEDQWLTEKYQAYSIARLIETDVPAGGRVFSFQPVAEAYTNREILVGFQGGENQVLRDILLTPLVEGFQASRRLTFTFAQRNLRKVRVVQTARAEPDQWSVTELRVLLGGQELQRAIAWRLRASPSPWDVQMAFDNSPVTRWRSWQTIEPGMFLEVDLGTPQTIDSVVLEASDDQGKVRLRLEGIDPQGGVVPLAAGPVQTGATVPPRLRRYAVEELKLRGVQYILVMEGDHGSADFRSKPMAWGITEAGESYGARLYRID